MTNTDTFKAFLSWVYGLGEGVRIEIRVGEDHFPAFEIEKHPSLDRRKLYARLGTYEKQTSPKDALEILQWADEYFSEAGRKLQFEESIEGIEEIAKSNPQFHCTNCGSFDHSGRNVCNCPCHGKYTDPTPPAIDLEERSEGYTDTCVLCSPHKGKCPVPCPCIRCHPPTECRCRSLTREIGEACFEHTCLCMCHPWGTVPINA